MATGGQRAATGRIATISAAVLTDGAGVESNLAALLGDLFEEVRRVDSSGLPGLAQALEEASGERVLVVAGDEGRIFRGFADACSPRAIGHMGAGGQIAWADPESGLSFAYLTNGAWRNPVRQGAQGLALSTLAAAALEG